MKGCHHQERQTRIIAVTRKRNANVRCYLPNTNDSCSNNSYWMAGPTILAWKAWNGRLFRPHNSRYATPCIYTESDLVEANNKTEPSMSCDGWQKDPDDGKTWRLSNLTMEKQYPSNRSNTSIDNCWRDNLQLEPKMLPFLLHLSPWLLLDWRWNVCLVSTLFRCQHNIINVLWELAFGMKRNHSHTQRES